MDSFLAQIMEPLIISKVSEFVSNRDHFFLSLPKPRELYELVAKFLRADNHQVDASPSSGRDCRYGVGLGPAPPGRVASLRQRGFWLGTL